MLRCIVYRYTVLRSMRWRCGGRRGRESRCDGSPASGLGIEFHGRLALLAEPRTFASWLRRLFRQDWVVYSKPPFGGPEHVLRYLGAYTHRVAISGSIENVRVVLDTGKNPSAVSQEIAEHLNLRGKPTSLLMSNGSVEVPSVVLPCIHVGSWHPAEIFVRCVLVTEALLCRTVCLDGFESCPPSLRNVTLLSGHTAVHGQYSLLWRNCRG
jgi:hypothetical protein